MSLSNPVTRLSCALRGRRETGKWEGEGGREGGMRFKEELEST